VASGECLKTLTGHEGAVLSVASLGPDSGLLASASYDRTVRIWSVSSGECLKTLRHPAVVQSVCSLGGGLIACASYGSGIYVWNVGLASAEGMKQLYRQSPLPSPVMNEISGFAGAPLDPHYFGGSTSETGEVRMAYEDPLTPEARRDLQRGHAERSFRSGLNELSNKTRSTSVGCCGRATSPAVAAAGGAGGGGAKAPRKRKSRRANRRKGTRRQRK
jgi:hypothetical protein